MRNGVLAEYGRPMAETAWTVWPLAKRIQRMDNRRGGRTCRSFNSAGFAEATTLVTDGPTIKVRQSAISAEKGAATKRPAAAGGGLTAKNCFPGVLFARERVTPSA